MGENQEEGYDVKNILVVMPPVNALKTNEIAEIIIKERITGELNVILKLPKAIPLITMNNQVHFLSIITLFV